MTLAEILNEMETQKGFQNADLTPQVINGAVPGQEIARTDALTIAKRQAVDRIEELRNMYDRTIYGSSAVVLLTGDTEKQKAFMELATRDEALCVQSDNFYRGIAASAMARMSMANIVNASVAQEVVEQIVGALGKFAPGTFLAYPRFPGEYVDSVVRKPEDMLAIVKQTAKPTVEIPLSITWLERNVAGLAFAQKFASEPLAVVVGIDDPADVPAWKMYFLHRCPRVLVNVDEGTTEEQLVKAKEGLNAAFAP